MIQMNLIDFYVYLISKVNLDLDVIHQFLHSLQIVSNSYVLLSLLCLVHYELDLLNVGIVNQNEMIHLLCLVFVLLCLFSVCDVFLLVWVSVFVVYFFCDVFSYFSFFYIDRYEDSVVDYICDVKINYLQVD